MEKSRSSKIVSIIYTIIVLVIIFALITFYKTHSFGEFTKAENIMGLTKFTRDSSIVNTYDYSYKLKSSDYNDAVFYKTIKVKPNTPYRLTCMVKTENVESENGKCDSGAQMSIINTTECSQSITGTSEWQQLEFIFDSKNRETIEVGFRLGGNNSKVKGTAWFSDFKLEEGIKDNSNNWNIACFLIKNIDIKLDNQNLKLSMCINDIEKMKENMDRFRSAARELSNGRMTVDYDTYEIDEPIQSITYSNEYGYYLDPTDVYDVIKDYLKMEEYDYIFVTTRLGDLEEKIQIPVYDWIGLRRYGFVWNRLFKY